MKKNLLITLVCFFQFAFIYQSFSQDAFLDVLVEELEREMNELKAEESAPYYISYRVDDVFTVKIDASFDAFSNAVKKRSKILTVTVRTGDHNLDNFHEIRGSFGGWSRSGKILLPQNISAAAIKQILWKETDKLYKNAVNKLDKVKANVAVKVEAEDKAPDFSKEEAIVNIDPILSSEFYSVDMEVWKEKLKKYSAEFLTNPDIYSGTANLKYVVNRKYFVSSEGTKIVQNETYSRVMLSGRIKADDGMVLPINHDWFGFTLDKLPSDDVIIEKAKEMTVLLGNLKDAPTVESYSGPAILSGAAAGVFFHEIFGHRIEGQRQKSEYDAQTFKKKIGKEVLPTHLNVIFDPALKSFEGLDLSGYYKYDDQGIKAEKVTVVEKGILKDFLMSRTPIDSFPSSNGHARAQAGKQPESRQSNMIVESSEPLSDSELRKMLIKELKDKDKEYGFFFKNVTGGFTMTGRFMPNSFNVTPTEVYRVFADGRQDELVRGVDMVGTPLAMFSQIEAAGDKLGLFTGMCGAKSGFVPVSSICPSLYVKMIELQKKSKSQQKPYLLKRPNENVKSEEVIISAMKDELKRNMDELRIEKLQAPFYIKYAVGDAEIMYVSGTLGEIMESQQKAVRPFSTRVITGDYSRTEENFKDINSWWSGGGGQSLPVEDNYNAIRRSLWQATDRTYKSAAENYERKLSAIKQQNLPEEIENVPDFSKIEVVKTNNVQKISLPEQKIWEEKVKKLSALFNKASGIYASNVSFYSYVGNYYFINSEGAEFVKPLNITGLQINAYTQAVDGEPIYDHLLYYGLSAKDIPSDEMLVKDIENLIAMMLKLREAPVIHESYSGPVIFEGTAAGELLTQRLLTDKSGLISHRKPIYSDPTAARYMKEEGKPLENKFGRKVISNDFTVKAVPYTKMHNKISLIGAFSIDAEGVVPQQELVLVEKGLLKGLLSDRTPTEKISISNGHKRIVFGNDGALSSAKGPGVISFNTATTVDYNKLKEKLLKAATEEGLDYAYIIKKMDVVNDGMYSLNIQRDRDRKAAGKVSKPLYVYKINVKDGKEELVRSASLGSISISAIKRIRGASEQQMAYNTLTKNKFSSYRYFYDDKAVKTLTGMPVSVIMPKAILFEEIDLDKETRELTPKLPVVGNPVAGHD